MMAFALGSLNWSERQFYCSTLRAFINAANGYNKEKKLLQTYMRRQAMIGYWAMGGKASSESIWPIDQDKDDGLEERLRAKLQRFKEQNAKALAQA